MNTVVQLRPSPSEKPTVRSGRAKNTEYRQREYLTEGEIDKLMTCAGEGRNPVRDRLLIMMAFRHALRVSELVDIRWQQIHRYRDYRHPPRQERHAGHSRFAAGRTAAVAGTSARASPF
jgi:integrase